jgi:hypothetical protein
MPASIGGFGLNPVDASHQNRSLGDEQLDDSIVDTLVSAFPRLSARHIFFILTDRTSQHLAHGAGNTANLREFGWRRRFRAEITSRYPLKANEEISDRIPLNLAAFSANLRREWG